MHSINQENIFFIIGIGRSGTTMLQEIFNTFEEFCNVEESHVEDPLSDSCWTAVRRSEDFSHLEEFMKRNWTRKYFVEKTPDSILCLPQMYQRFPKSNYIFLERDPFQIVLSQLNLFPTSDLDQTARNFHIRNLIMTEEDLKLSHEQYWAKLTVKQIHYQTSHKSLFSNSLTIRYDELVSSLDSTLLKIEKIFGIKCDRNKAIGVLSRPSSSSKNNKYEIKKIQDVEAIHMLEKAARLWQYKITS